MIQETERWWERRLEAIENCLKEGKIMAYVKSNHVITIVLVTESGNRITIHRPWKLW